MGSVSSTQGGVQHRLAKSEALMNNVKQAFHAVS